jgi:plastocyanin
MIGLVAMLLLLLPSLFLGSGKAAAATPPTLTVIPSSFASGDANCPANGNGWTCKATLTSSAGATGKLNWSTSSSLAGVTFTPATGTLAPGKSVVVKIAVPLAACSSGIFTFTGPNNSVQVAWSCTPPPPPTMTATPAKLSPASTACASASGGYSCTVKVAETRASQGPLNWSASSSLSGVTFSPASGTLTPGKNVSVTIGSLPCSSSGVSGSVTFSGAEGETPVTVTWHCKASTAPATLVVTPTSLDPANAACGTSGSIIQCTVTLSETASSTVNANWVANTTFSDSAVVPTQGTLTPGTSTQVVLDSLPCQDGSVTFSGAEGEAPVTVTFSCTPNSLTASPTQLDPTNAACAASGSAYSCAMTLAETAGSPGTVSWTASSDLSNVSFSPASGTLSPGQSISVTVAGIPCQSGSFLFSGPPALTLNALTTWSCTPPPPPPLLFVSTSSLTPIQCQLASSVGIGTYQCSVTLTEAAYSVGPANWSASSDNATTFSPASGTLQPGNSVTVTADIPCQDGTMTFSGAEGETPVTVSWGPCTPSEMVITPANLDPSNANCSGSVFTLSCYATLSMTGTTGIPITWTMSGDFTGVVLNVATPTSGTLSGGQTAWIGFNELPCSNRTFTFTGANGETPVVLQWTCTPPPATLSVSDQSLAPGNTDCAQVSLDPLYTCHVTLSASPGSGTTDWGIGTALPATLSPSYQGTIAGGQQIDVYIEDIPCQSGTFTFYELWLTDPLVVNWTCSSSSTQPLQRHAATANGPSLLTSMSSYSDRRRWEL